MKKLLALLLALTMVVALCACGQTAKKDEGPHIGIVTGSVSPTSPKNSRPPFRPSSTSLMILR